MKHIKKIAFMILVVAFAMPAFQSCKKGENDPFLSIKSRKARLKGVWNLSARSETRTQAQTGVSTTSVYTFNGTMMTVMSGGASNSYIYSEKITFNTDGTFTKEETSSSSGSTSNITIKGNWWFGKNNKEADYKNGEVVVLQITNVMIFGSGGYSAAFTGADCPIIFFVIDQLKSKEMIVIEDGKDTDGTTSVSTSGTSTYVKA